MKSLQIDRRLALAAFAAIAVGFWAVGGASAQVAGARLSGTVKDASGGVIPGASVTATNEATSISSTTITNESGLYVFVNLAPASYTLASELQGFKRYVSKGIVLQIGATATVNITLETGETNTEVVVNAAAPLIDLTSGKVGAVVQERQVVDLPLNGRNPMMLYYLQGGTNPLDTYGGLWQMQVGGVDGLRTNSNNVKIEGIWAMDAAFDYSPANPNAAVPLEAVGEYRVTTSMASADLGRGAGAQIQVVYRSGSNNFHGGAYEFNRNTVYNANNFFSNRGGTPRPTFLRNQYGVSLGGPIRRGKTFFFATWEGLREIQGVIENRNVYTDTLRNGIFRYNTTGANATSSVDRNGNPVVPFGTIDIYNVDPTRRGPDTSGIVAGYLKVIPLPNNYDIGDGFNLAGYRYTSSNPTEGDQLLIKIDHTIGTKHQLSTALGANWLKWYQSKLFSGYHGYLNREPKRNIMIGLVSVLGTNLTNELRVGATRDGGLVGPENPANFDTNGVFSLSGLGTGRYPSPQGNPVPPFLPQSSPVVAYNLNDNIAWVKSNHAFKVGFEVIHATDNNLLGGDEYIPAIYTANASNPANVPTLPGLATTDRSRAQQMVNDLTGTIGNINQTYNANSLTGGFLPYQGANRHIRQREWGAFVTDTWKVAQNLTINYGTRWDFLPPGYMSDGVSSYPTGGAGGVLGVSGPLGNYATEPAPDGGKGIMNLDWNNFGPHLGFTWDPMSDGKTSVSAYYRVAYDRVSQSTWSGLINGNQGLTVSTTATPFTRFSDPNLYQAVAGKPAILPIAPPSQPFFPVPFTRLGNAIAIEEDASTPYTQSWSLRVQRELAQDWFVQGAYVGNIAVGGWRGLNYNQLEIRSNGFLTDFLAAQRNLAARGNPNIGEPIGVLGSLFAPLGGIPTTQYGLITQGQATALADFIETTTLGTGTRGGLVTQAGLPISFFRANPQVANANIVGNLRVSTWHGLKMEVGKRFSHGSYLQFNYTLGKGLTDSGAPGLTTAFRDNLDRRLDKTLQDFDSTHVIQANGIWELPFGPGKPWLAGVSGWKAGVVGGWQVNGILQYATSRPVTITSGFLNLSQASASTPFFSGKDFNLMSKVIRGDQIRFLTDDEKKLFTNPPAGSPGGVPLRAFRGPAYTTIDASLFKNFRWGLLGEQGNIQFRAEAFNLLNHTNFVLQRGFSGGAVTPSVLNNNDGNFGVIDSAFSPRIIQFALKLSF